MGMRTPKASPRSGLRPSLARTARRVMWSVRAQKEVTAMKQSELLGMITMTIGILISCLAGGVNAGEINITNQPGDAFFTKVSKPDNAVTRERTKQYDDWPNLIPRAQELNCRPASWWCICAPSDRVSVFFSSLPCGRFRGAFQHFLPSPYGTPVNIIVIHISCFTWIVFRTGTQHS